MVYKVRSGHNTILRDVDVERIDADMVEAVVPKLNALQVLETVTTDPGTQFYGVDKWSHMSGVKIIGKGGKFPRGRVNASRSVVHVEKIGAGFDVPREDVLSSTAVETTNAQSAAREVARGINDLCFNGSTVPAINGIVNGALQTHACAANWSAAPAGADAYEDIRAAIGILEALGYEGPFSLVTDPTNLSELRIREVKAGGAAVSYLSLILGDLVAEVISDAMMPHGTPVLIEKGRHIARWVQAEPITTEVHPMNTEQTFPVNVYTRGVPYIVDGNGILKLTNA